MQDAYLMACWDGELLLIRFAGRSLVLGVCVKVSAVAPPAAAAASYKCKQPNYEQEVRNRMSCLLLLSSAAL